MMEQATFRQDDDLKFLQDDLRNRGNGLSKAWADLFSLLTTYQARLMVKENQLDISEKQIESKRQQLTMLKDGVALPSSHERLQYQCDLKEQLLSKCQTELLNATQMLKGAQAEISSQAEHLEKVRSEKLEKEDMILQYQNRIAQLESDLRVKEEESEIKDRLIQKLQTENLCESSNVSDANTGTAKLKELFDMQTKTLDDERSAHKETRRRLQMHQRYGVSIPAKMQGASSDSVAMPEMETPPSDYQYTGFTSPDEPTSSQGMYQNTPDQHDSNAQKTQSTLDAKLDEAMALYTESYSVTKNQDWRPESSTPEHTGKYPDTSHYDSDAFPGVCGTGHDAIISALQMPVPVSDPVPSTSILRIAAEEAKQQQSEALRTRNKGPRGLNNAYDLATLEIAMTKVRTGEMSLRKAANIYNVPKTTLSTYVKELKKPGGRHGRGGCISLEDEREVIKLSLEYTEKGLKFGRKELLNLLAQYFDSKQMPNPFKCGLPGKDWWLNVRKRHPDLIKIKSKASNKSLAVKMQYVNESNTSASELNTVKDELDLSNSMNESGSSGGLGLEVLQRAAGTGVGDDGPHSQGIYGPLMNSNMDE